MPRPREHNQSDVRLVTLRTFWEHGYSATTMVELQAATGIDKKQMSRDFGNKKGLFLSSLEDYVCLLREQILVGLDAEDAGIKSVRAVFQRIIKFSGQPDGHFGCLLCVTALDARAMEDQEISKAVKSGMGLMELSYSNALRCANSSGELSLSRSEVRKLARSLMGAHISLVVLMRLGSEKSTLFDIAENALAPLTAR